MCLRGVPWGGCVALQPSRCACSGSVLTDTSPGQGTCHAHTAEAEDDHTGLTRSRAGRPLTGVRGGARTRRAAGLPRPGSTTDPFVALAAQPLASVSSSSQGVGMMERGCEAQCFHRKSSPRALRVRV